MACPVDFDIQSRQTLDLDIGGSTGKQGPKGEDAKINGYNTIEIVAGDNINLEQEENVLRIGATYGELQQELDNLDIEVNNLTHNSNLMAQDINTHTGDINELEQEVRMNTDNIFDLEGSLNHLDDIKANIDDTYTKQQVDELIGSIENVRIEVVDYLPEVGQSNVIYFVRERSEESSDIFDEYIWESDKYELIGNTAIDLSNYVTMGTFIGRLNSFYTKSECDEQYEAKMPNSYDYCIQSVLYGDGESGYRKYKNGMLEQWGVATTQASETEFTMHQPHSNTNFSIFIEPREMGNFYHYAMPSGNQKFKCRIQSRDSVSMAIRFQWRSFGRWK